MNYLKWETELSIFKRLSLQCIVRFVFMKRVDHEQFAETLRSKLVDLARVGADLTSEQQVVESRWHRRNFEHLVDIIVWQRRLASLQSLLVLLLLMKWSWNILAFNLKPQINKYNKYSTAANQVIDFKLVKLTSYKY